MLQNNIRLGVDCLKSTGVVRRIDELGRIVIPKEIRRNLKIRDGENIEIFVDMDGIILKKYSKIEDSIEYAKKICSLLSKITNSSVLITDRDYIIAVEGSFFAAVNGEAISKDLTMIVDSRDIVLSPSEETISITNGLTLTGFFCILPIITSADSIGLVLVYSNEKNLIPEKSLTQLASELIAASVDVA